MSSEARIILCDCENDAISMLRSLVHLDTNDLSTIMAADAAKRVYSDPYDFFDALNKLLDSGTQSVSSAIFSLTQKEIEFLKETQLQLLISYHEAFAFLRQRQLDLNDLFSLFKALYGEFRWPVVSAVVSNPSLLRKSSYADAVVHFLAKTEWLCDSVEASGFTKAGLSYLKNMLLGLSDPQEDASPKIKRHEFNRYALKLLSDKKCEMLNSTLTSSYSALEAPTDNAVLRNVEGSELPLHFLRFVSGLPKSELHAHISGSIRMDTLTELSQLHFDDFDEKLKQCCVRAGSAEKRDLNECFQLFKVLHHIIDSTDVVKRVTYEVLSDFVLRDRVIYVELRTTPRNLSNGDSKLGKRQYLEAVCEALQTFDYDVKRFNKMKAAYDNDDSKENSDVSQTLNWLPATSRISTSAPWFIDAKLLVSIDRSDTPESALETLNIVQDLRGTSRAACERISGLDFSGNPFVRGFSEFKEVFSLAREGRNSSSDVKPNAQPLPITVHFAETTSMEDANSILEFSPERVGHAALLTEETYCLVREKNIPVEICLTSNFACKLHEDLISHPFRRFYEANHPISLCTDDKGIFISPLIREYLYLIGEESVVRLATNSHAKGNELEDFCRDLERLGRCVEDSVNMWFTDKESKDKGLSQIQSYVKDFCEGIRSSSGK